MSDILVFVLFLWYENNASSGLSLHCMSYVINVGLLVIVFKNYIVIIILVQDQHHNLYVIPLINLSGKELKVTLM